MVVPIRLLIQVTEQVERFDRNVGAVDRPFEQAPKVFNSICVNVLFYISLKMVDDLVNISVLQVVVALKFIAGALLEELRLLLRLDAFGADRQTQRAPHRNDRVGDVVLWIRAPAAQPPAVPQENH